MSLRNEQVASALHRALQQVLARGLSDPRVRGLISVTAVRVSKDGADATVMVSVLPEDAGELTMHGLRHATNHIRTQVGRSVRIRRMPRLAFKLDRSLKAQARVLSALNRAAARSTEPSSDTDGELPDQDPRS